MISNELLKNKILDEAIHGRLIENDPSLPPVDVEEIKECIPFGIPNNWKWTTLKIICNIITGKKDANFGDDKGEYDFFTCALESIKCNSYSYEGEYLICPGNGANVGKTIYYDGKFEAYQRNYLISIKPLYNIKLKYLYYYFLRYWEEYNTGKMYGSAIPYIRLGNLENFQIPMPPLEEQEKIVKKIEELFELINKKEKNDKEKEKLKEVLKSKILEEELPISDIATHKLSDFLEKTYNVNWKDTTKEFCYIDLSSVDRQKHIIETTNIIDYNNAPSRAKQIVKKNDVLFGTTRPLLGRVCIVDEKYDNQICSTGFCVMRPKKDLLDSKFLEFIIRSSEFIKYIEPLQRGVSYPAVSDKDVYNYKISIPPLEQQKKIVEKIEKCFELIEQL